MTSVVKTCPTCGVDGPPGATHCPKDGAVLVGGDDGTLVRDPLVGQRVGEYVVRRRIGAGGMGIVYECVHPIIGKRAAVKVLRPELAEAPEQMERLLAEARAVAAIDHRAVIGIFGFGQLPDGRHYMVTEYVDGEPLDVVLDRRGKLPLAEALEVIDGILSGLGAAHAAGVIHRDLKPSNVILLPQADGSLALKVLDFGLAKQTRPNETTPQTNVARVLGTPEYMAPEQGRGLAVGPRTDLYAVGVIAYELVTGEVPFSAASPVEIMFRHFDDVPPAPSSRVASLPRGYDELVARLLAKAPDDRPASAEEARQLVAKLRAPGAPKPRASRPRHPVTRPDRSEDRTQPAGRPLEALPAPAIDATVRELPQVSDRAPTTQDTPAASSAQDRTAPVPQYQPASRLPLLVGGTIAVLVIAIGAWLVFAPGAPPTPEPTTPRAGPKGPTAGSIPRPPPLVPSVVPPSEEQAGPAETPTAVTAPPTAPPKAASPPPTPVPTRKALLARISTLRKASKGNPAARADLDGIRDRLSARKGEDERERAAAALDAWESRYLKR